MNRHAWRLWAGLLALGWASGAGGGTSVFIDGETVTASDWTGLTYADSVLTIQGSAEYVLSGTSTAVRVLVPTGASVAVVASNLSLAVPSGAGFAFQSAFRLEANAAVELTVLAANVCKSGYGCAGIQVDEGARLEIADRSTGSMAAYGGGGGAGIGGGAGTGAGSGTVAGRIEIGGGRIQATGGAGWLGSGRSDGRPSGGAGIGGGADQDAETIIVSGGDVIAHGAGDAAGIGGGKPRCGNEGGQWHRVGGNGGTIVISGGRVKGIGAGHGAGLGGGGIYTNIVYTNQYGEVILWDAVPGSGANITMSGGTVIAKSGTSSMPLYGASDIGPGVGRWFAYPGSLMVSGGSLVGTVASRLTPTNAQGTAVFGLKLMGLTPGEAFVCESGLPEGYSATNLIADDEGVVGLWLPAGTYDLRGAGLHYDAVVPEAGRAYPRLRVDGAEVSAGSAGDGWTYDGTRLRFSGAGSHGIAGGGTNVRVVVESGATVSLTLSNVVANAAGEVGACAFLVETGAQADVTVLNSAYFASGPGRAGVEIAEGGSLRVSEASRGIIRAGGSFGGAGIGGAEGERAGALTVAGGTIWTVGAHGSAAIGAGAAKTNEVQAEEIDWEDLLAEEPGIAGLAPVFAGGSIVTSGAGVEPAPVDPDGKRLYEVRIAGFWPLETIAEIEGVPAGYATNGITADGEGVVCLWLPEGRHSLRLAGRAWEGTRPAGTWYADARRPDDDGDGRTRETAKKTLQAAVDAAAAGETVIVLDGAYGPIIATNAIVIRSDNGADHAFIDGGGADRCATLGVETRLVGLTLTNGLAENGGGVHGGIMERCRLTGNQAQNEGGGAYTGKLTRCVLDGNAALHGGGSARGQLERCRLVGNRASSDGGGAYRGVLNDCWLAGNSATNDGGGACESTVARSRFSGNAAAHGGGGACNGPLRNCVLENNVAGGRGGGMYGGGLANCVLTGNSSGSTGGGAESAIMTGCTLWGNRASQAGGGSAWGRLFNCIVWGNEAGEGNNVYEPQSQSSHNCTAPALQWAGAGNIGDDPRLIMPEEGRFELRAGSPCLNAGANARAEGATDVAGNERISAGHAVDMGAFEMPGGTGMHYVRMEGFGGSVIALGDRAVTNGGRLTFVAQETAGRAFVAFLTNGVHASSHSTFTWENITESGTLTAVFASIALYADPSRPDDAGDGRSWATAKRTLQAAVDAALDGDDIRVAPGTYGPIATSNRSLHVISREGPEHTWIDGQGLSRCATLSADASGTNTVLAGFTLRNGRADRGGGSFGGTLQRCLLVGNEAASEGGGAHGGKLVNCVVRGNESGYVGGGVSRAEIVGCTVAMNRAMDYGGGVAGTRLHNSIVWGNEAGNEFGANVTGADPSSAYNCTEPLLSTEGTGNLCGDPLFLAMADGRFELRAGSPCVNSGASERAEGAEDIAGAGRIVGPAVDMGAFEMPGGTGYAGFYVAMKTGGHGTVVADGDQAVMPGASLTFAAQETAGRAFVGFFTNGAFASSNSTFTWEHVAADGVLTGEFEKWTFWVDGARPDDAGDGLSPASAKRTLQAAVDAALGGDAVRVAPGTYGPISTANLALDVRSLEGPEVTRIEGGGTRRCATLGDSPAETNTVLAGFTLQNGCAEDGGGARGGTLVQCVLLGNVAGSCGGGARYGTLRDCVLRGNAAYDGGGAYQAALADCTVSGNRASSCGGGASECALVRCRLQDNEADYGGGGSAWGSLSECWLTGNVAYSGGGACYGKLVNSVLTGNRADYGGGSYGSDMTGCTVSGNQAGSYGGGSCYGTWYNSIVWGNVARREGNNAYWPSSSSSFNCTDPVLSSSYATGNVGGDPLFLAPQEQRFELRAGSPCLNAGSSAHAEGVADLAGRERISGGSVDLGAHEMPAGAGFAGHYIALDICGRGSVDVSGDRAVADGASLTFTASETAGRSFLGFYTNGAFAASNAVFTWDRIAADGTLTAVFELATMYADAARPDDAGDGWTWATAKRTLQAAVDAALAGSATVDEVVVAPGLYGPIETANRKLAIRSSEGAAVTVLSGNGLARCATLAADASGTNTLLSGFTLQDGEAEEGGGAYGGTLEDCILSGNHAHSGGGAYGGRLRRCLLTRNTANMGGGASDEYAGLQVLEDCDLRENEAFTGGGTFYGSLSRCRLQGNVAEYGGGAAYSNLRNCVLVGNQANRGGGAIGGRLVGCTVWGNQATEQGGGTDDVDDMALCIVWGNEAPTDPNVANAYGEPVRWSCTEPVQAGEGNVAADPLFLAPADGRFELLAGSPCLDAGANAGAEGERDIKGNARIAGARVDIGAVEMPGGSGFAGLYVGLEVRGNGTVSVVGDRAVEPGGSLMFTASETAGRPFAGYYLNGAWATSNKVFTWENVATDGVVTAEFETWTFHVDAARPDDAGDGRSWATAKRTLQAAVEAARDGEEILAAAGTYGPIETKNRRLSIRGVDGAGAARIDGGGSNRCANLAALLPAMTNTALAGFTLSNGYADCGGGSRGGALTDCVLSGNRAESGGGAYGSRLVACVVSGNAADYGGGACRGSAEECVFSGNAAFSFGGGSYEGRLVRCRFADNQAEYGGGAAAYADMSNCELTGNQAGFGGGAYGGHLVNCTVSGNGANRGGGMQDGTLVNCIVWGNTDSNQECDNWSLSWGGEISYTCTAPLPDGTGNIEANPRFVDAEQGNYRIMHDSPCRDAGSLAAVPGGTDLDGSRRIQGQGPDLGAYESGGCNVRVMSRDEAGNPMPPAGWHAFDLESGTRTATVSRTAVVDSRWKGYCAGWTGQGCVPASGTGTVVAFSPSFGVSTLSWTWVATDYWLDVSVAKGKGTTDHTFGWKSAGEAVALAALPAEPGAAAWWTEDGELVRTGGAHQVQMDRPRNLQVWFAQAAVVVHAGRLAGDETWGASAVHLVLGPVVVPSGTSLVIERSAIVKFVPGAGISVESGGSCLAQGVVFTHVNDDTAGGDTFLDGEGAKPLVNQYSLSGDIRTDFETDARFVSLQVSEQDVASAATWSGQRVYHVDKTITVQSGGRLTIQPGAIVKFGPGASLVVAEGGELQALGHRANPIVFTSRKDDARGGDSNGDGSATVPDMGDYRAIQVRGRAAFDHCSFLYGGNTLWGTWSEAEGGALVFGPAASATVSNCVIADSRFEGFISESSDLIVANTVIRHCDRGCNVLGGAPTLVNCVSYGCRWGWLFHGGAAHVVNCSVAEFTELGIYGGCQMENSHGYSSRVPTSSWWATNYGGYVGMKTGAPLFQDPENGDFRLRPGSPLIDAGNGTLAPETDAFGRPRMDDPYVADTGLPGTNGVCPDIGIYEMDCANAGSDWDLAVERVRSPRAVTVGESIRIEWQVVNVGSASISGSWRDAVSLVTADGFAVRSLGEKTITSSSALKPGQAKECFALFEVPAVKEGEWFVQVQANAYRDVYEGSLVSNNFGMAGVPMVVSMPSLGLGEEWTGRAAAGGAVFRLAGGGAEAMVARIQASSGAVVLCGLGFMPSESQYSSRVTCGADGLALITIPAGQTAYLRVLGGSEDLGDVAIRTASAALEVTRVEPATVPASGMVSLTVRGAHFSTNSRIRLVGGGAAVSASHVLHVSSDCLIATLDGAALSPGATYDVEVVDGGATGGLARAVSVSTAPAKYEFKARLTVPAAVRHMRRMTIQVDYENAGSREMPAPILEIVATGMVFTVGNQAYTNSVELLALAPRSPVGSLAPGESNRLSVAAMMIEPLPAMAYELRARHVGTAGATEPVEWRRLFNEDWVLYPEDGAEDAVDTAAVRNALQERIGATRADYYARLGRYLSEAEASGVNVTADYGLESGRFVEALYWEAMAELSGDDPGPTSAFRRPTVVRRSDCDHGPGVIALAGDNWKATPDGAVWAYCRGCRNWVYGWETDPAVRSRYFDPAKSTYLICHGHQNCIGEAWILNMAEALRGVEPDANLLAINWGTVSKVNPLPHVTAPSLFGVAEKAVADCRSFLVPERTTLIGHSHGGHVVGFLTVLWPAGGTFRRVVGLDTSTCDIWVHAWAVAPQAWIQRIRSRAAQVEFYKSSWDLSLEQRNELFGHYNFAVKREGDFFEKRIGFIGGLDRHGWAIQWFIDSIVRNYENKGYRFQGAASWAALSGGLPAPANDRILGVFRDNVLECLAPVREGRGDWRYGECLLDGQNLGMKALSSLHQASILSFDYDSSHAGPLPTRLRTEGRNACTWLVANEADNRSIPYRDLWNFVTRYKPAAPWDKPLGCGAWLVDYETLTNRVPSAAAIDWGSATLEDLQDCLAAAGSDNLVRRIGTVSVQRRDFVLPESLGTYEIPMRVSAKPFGRPLVATNGISSRLLLAVGAGVDVADGDLPSIHAGDLDWSNNFRFGLVEFSTGQVCAVMAAEREPGAGRSRLADGASLPVEADPDGGSWSVVFDGRSSYERLASGATQSVAAWTWDVAGDVAASVAPQGNGNTSRVSGRLPAGVDGARFAVTLTVRGANGEEDSVACELDVRRKCEEDEGEKKDSAGSNTPYSFDPNEMAGPVGITSPSGTRYVAAGDWLSYVIYFENKAEATAAAQMVAVSNALSPYLDWSSLQMGEVAFNNQLDLGLDGQSQGSTETDLENSVYRVRTLLTLDRTNGVAHWVMRIVDGTTPDGWPEDPYAGFLPPNDGSHRGEGHLAYRIRVREDAPIGALIPNSATIVFDYNEPIVTDPAWWNIVESVVRVALDAGEGNRSEAAFDGIEGHAFGDLPRPERDGYAFDGWWTGEGGTGTRIACDTVVSPEIQMLYAHWLADNAIFLSGVSDPDENDQVTIFLPAAFAGLDVPVAVSSGPDAETGAWMWNPVGTFTVEADGAIAGLPFTSGCQFYRVGGAE